MTWTPIKLRRRGEIAFIGEAEGAGGGSQPDGAYNSAEFLFTETAGAGVYTASLPVPAGTVVMDVLLYPLAYQWAADAAALKIGDSLGGPGAYWDFDIVGAFSGDYDPATAQGGNDVGGTVQFYSGLLTQSSWAGVRYDADDTITMTITTTGAGGATGVLLAKIIYFTPVAATDAVKS